METTKKEHATFIYHTLHICHTHNLFITMKKKLSNRCIVLLVFHIFLNIVLLGRLFVWVHLLLFIQVNMHYKTATTYSYLVPYPTNTI